MKVVAPAASRPSRTSTPPAIACQTRLADHNVVGSQIEESLLCFWQLVLVMHCLPDSGDDPQPGTAINSLHRVSMNVASVLEDTERPSVGAQCHRAKAAPGPLLRLVSCQPLFSPDNLLARAGSIGAVSSRSPLDCR